MCLKLAEVRPTGTEYTIYQSSSFVYLKRSSLYQMSPGPERQLSTNLDTVLLNIELQI